MAPAAFVTGGLDPAATREAFLKLFQTLVVPLWVVIGKQSPASSGAEMDNVQNKRPPGSLEWHEE